MIPQRETEAFSKRNLQRATRGLEKQKNSCEEIIPGMCGQRQELWQCVCVGARAFTNKKQSPNCIQRLLWE